MAGPSAAFPKTRKRREQGSIPMSPYRLTWRSSPWQPFIAAGANLTRATANGTSRSIAEDQSSGPGVYELAIAYKDVAHKRIKVYIAAVESLRDAIVTLAHDGGDLQGFLDDAIKKDHVVWLRCKPTKTLDDAVAIRDKALDAFDYAWVQQPGSRGRSLIVRPNFLCGCCCRTGLQIKDGPPKFVQPKTGGLMSLLSGKSGKKR